MEALIIEPNIEKLKYILNIINNKIKEINIRYIATTIDETKETLAKENINLILMFQENVKLNTIVYKYIEEIENIKELKIIYFFKYKKYTCFKSEKKEIFLIDSNEPLDVICKKIKKAISEDILDTDTENIQKKITFKLIELGYNLKYKGTFYLIDAIEHCYKNDTTNMLNNLEKNVYTYVANKYNKSVNNIKTNVIKATQMLLKNNIVKSEYYTPKLVIIMVLLYLK